LLNFPVSSPVITSGSVTSPVLGFGAMVRRRWKDPVPSAVQTEDPKTKVSPRLKVTVGLMEIEGLFGSWPQSATPQVWLPQKAGQHLVCLHNLIATRDSTQSQGNSPHFRGGDFAHHTPLRRRTRRGGLWPAAKPALKPSSSP
jgi:hypothetical protein